jgi:hypothetical protein
VAPAQGGRPRSTADFACELDPTGLGDAGETLDLKARAAYRSRLREIDTELAEAERHNDLGRLDRLQREREALEAELSSAVGLGGRARRAASAAERARLNVTRAIKSAILRIDAIDPQPRWSSPAARADGNLLPLSSGPAGRGAVDSGWLTNTASNRDRQFVPDDDELSDREM